MGSLNGLDGRVSVQLCCAGSLHTVPGHDVRGMIDFYMRAMGAASQFTAAAAAVIRASYHCMLQNAPQQVPATCCVYRSIVACMPFAVAPAAALLLLFSRLGCGPYPDALRHCMHAWPHAMLQGCCCCCPLGLSTRSLKAAAMHARKPHAPHSCATHSAAAGAAV